MPHVMGVIAWLVLVNVKAMQKWHNSRTLSLVPTIFVQHTLKTLKMHVRMHGTDAIASWTCGNACLMC